jgi:HPt (histidine-containing phosphotransfer) domain-containing protein
MPRLNSSSDPFAGKGEAIFNLGGKESLYLKYVNQFQTHYQDSCQLLCYYLECRDYENAHILVHSIKGLASTLGMLTLKKQAEALEITLREGKLYALPALLIAFQIAMSQVVQTPFPHSSSSVGT